MNCRHAQHLLDGYLDGELPASLRAEVHAHRLTCPDCQRAMAVVEVAGDVIGDDVAAPVLSLGFTDRVMGGMKPLEEPRVARIVRFRRVAVFLGPVLSVAAVWMVVVSALPRIEHVSGPIPLSDTKVVLTPQTAGVVEMAPAPTASATIADLLTEGLLSPARATWRDTQRSTRDLLTVYQWVFPSAAESLGSTVQEGTDGAESGVLLQAEHMLMKVLAPKAGGETVAESSDVL